MHVLPGQSCLPLDRLGEPLLYGASRRVPGVQMMARGRQHRTADNGRQRAASPFTFNKTRGLLGTQNPDV
jgi:hypothetical protein